MNNNLLNNENVVESVQVTPAEKMKLIMENTFLSMFRPLVLNGPSGCGKSTLLNKLMGKYKTHFAFSVSHTTRSPRQGEQDGKDYHFVTRDAMEKLIAAGHFLEHAEFAGNMYGTSLDAVEKVQSSGRICVLDIDKEGVKSVKKSSLNARFVFISPPSYEILEKRLRDRGTETEDKITARLARSKIDMEFSKTPGIFDLIVVNDDIEDAFKNLEAFLSADLKAIQADQ